MQDIYPLAPLQEGILFHHLMEKEGDTYLLPSLLGFKTRERLDRFVWTLQAVIDRHDILRTAIVWEGLPEPVQVVRRRASLAVETVAYDPAQGEVAEQLKAAYGPRRYRIDVRRAPLLRAFATQDEAQGRWLLLILAHHLAMDHTTLELLVGEAELIEQGRGGELGGACAVPKLRGAGAARCEPGRARGVLPQDAGRRRRADGAVRADGRARRRRRGSSEARQDAGAWSWRRACGSRRGGSG